MVNYYFHSDTQVGESSSIKLRAFYNQFLNDIDMSGFPEAGRTWFLNFRYNF